MIKKGESLKLSFKLTNTGAYKGEEVVQLYLQDKVATVVRPVKELKDFKKVMLLPGESKVINFVVSPDQLSFYKPGAGWQTEPGTFKLMLGTSSDLIRLEKDFELK
ncbi:fibronectin type III-like domain-contianing protein [Pedobacter sp. KBW06]|uniref:fibronectin type III-like domain-contianing protein n=1 Tax=Pedobacter sp. KBW06 TaxID=2153359 RepID=UPI001F1EAC8F|nr:fibronectin type III-like domain-contianing protein [Pedobacter sp. KBW06]